MATPGAANRERSARLARSVADDTNEVQMALDTALRLAPNNPAIAQARHDLLPPPIPTEHFPQRLTSLGFTGHTAQVSGKLVEYIVPPLCEVPAGPFLMGSDPTRDSKLWENEKPQHTVTLAAYQIARYPVTIAEYACFVRIGHAEPVSWTTQLSKLDQPWHLSTEAEWEKAARGVDGYIYPWGNTFDKGCCNSKECDLKTTTPVGIYPNGASRYGALDMAGNVWEWTSSLYKQYPYNAADGREADKSTEERVLRGGSWVIGPGDVRAARRAVNKPDNFQAGSSSGNYGFRLALSSPSS